MSPRFEEHVDEMDLGITGEDGELIDRLVVLSDRSTTTNPRWWHTATFFAGLPVHAFVTPNMARETALEHLRNRLQSVVAAGVDEDFLVGHVASEVDSYYWRRADPLNWHVHGLNIARRRARQRRETGRPLSRESASEAQELQGATGRWPYPISADDASQRWAEAEEWARARGAVLPRVALRHWRMLRDHMV